MQKVEQYVEKQAELCKQNDYICKLGQKNE